MKYNSTRGDSKDMSFEEVLFSGFAPDGGLFVPECIPTIDNDTLTQWVNAGLSYPQVVLKVVRQFIHIDEIPNDVLEFMVYKAYAKFKVPEKVGLVEITNQRGRKCHIAELFHGPTASFKDYALSLVGQLINYFSNKRKNHTIILVGTSGDTGSAAIEAVRGLDSVDIIVLYPKGKVSRVQELQITTGQYDNVHLFEVEGTSDDLDVPIKKCFPAPGLISINSINWSRIMVQIAHFVYLYLHAKEEIDVFVPTGAAGNLVSGVIAKLMGVPINLYGATNENDNVANMVNEETLVMGGTVTATPASAMDIRFPYNVERILYFCSFEPSKLGAVMDSDKPEPIPKYVINEMKNCIKGCFVETTIYIGNTMKECWDLSKYMICPHTAIALGYFNRNVSSNVHPTYIISTASPQKFPEWIESTGIPLNEWDSMGLAEKLEKQPKSYITKMRKGDDWVQILQKEIKNIQVQANYLKYLSP